jgi:hypothetical protein
VYFTPAADPNRYYWEAFLVEDNPTVRKLLAAIQKDTETVVSDGSMAVPLAAGHRIICIDTRENKVVRKYAILGDNLLSIDRRLYACTETFHVLQRISEDPARRLTGARARELSCGWAKGLPLEDTVQEASP